MNTRSFFDGVGSNAADALSPWAPNVLVNNGSGEAGGVQEACGFSTPFLTGFSFISSAFVLTPGQMSGRWLSRGSPSGKVHKGGGPGVPVDAGALVSCELRRRRYRRSSSPRAPRACHTESSFCAASPHPTQLALQHIVPHNPNGMCSTAKLLHMPLGSRVHIRGHASGAPDRMRMRNRARAPRSR